ncbi:MAG TPA: uroporphyrinogen-III synthase [Pyrinomonadaceae bacterium]|nr:uroporphyrinogen-III synthase [Pyrinomonadaceae bacterium]
MKEVLVVRGEDEFSRTLMASGFLVINCPVIRTEPLEDLSDLENAVSRLDAIDGVFITSAAAAEIFARYANERLTEYHGRVFVLGQRSFDILKNTAADIVFVETANTAGDMLDAIAADNNLGGKRFLFVRGERSMLTIPEQLNGLADLEEAVVYRTVEIAISDEQKKDVRKKAERGEIAMACFFSPSGVESFVEQFGVDTLRLTRLAAIGETTADMLRGLVLNVDVVAKRAKSEHFAVDVLGHLNAAAQRSLV